MDPTSFHGQIEFISLGNNYMSLLPTPCLLSWCPVFTLSLCTLITSETSGLHLNASLNSIWGTAFRLQDVDTDTSLKPKFKPRKIHT